MNPCMPYRRPPDSQRKLKSKYKGERKEEEEEEEEGKYGTLER